MEKINKNLAFVLVLIFYWVIMGINLTNWIAIICIDIPIFLILFSQFVSFLKIRKRDK
jgi:hypothetical protein